MGNKSFSKLTGIGQRLFLEGLGQRLFLPPTKVTETYIECASLGDVGIVIPSFVLRLVPQRNVHPPQLQFILIFCTDSSCLTAYFYLT